jgi:hypothetical protein
VGLPAALALAVTLCIPGSAFAQFGGTQFGPPPQQFAPPSGPSAAPPPAPIVGAPARAIPTLPPPAPRPAPQASANAGQVALSVAARFSRDASQPISNGLTWRVFPAKPDGTRGFRPLREGRTATPTFSLPPGDYVVHVAFGLASIAKPVSLRSEPVREIFDLPAGAIRMEGRVADTRIPAGQISFDVYPGSQFDTGDRQPIVSGVSTGDLVVVPEGTYYIVSNYGDSNATVRSDIRVQAGKLTDVTISHRAAVIMLKLVNNSGGEALANTEWTVLTPGGDVIKESTGAFPRVVLAEGDYRAIARNEGKTFRRDFKVTTGVDGEIEVLTH